MLDRLRGLLKQRRRRIFLAVLGGIYALAYLGVFVAIYIPFIGGPFFLAGLMVWLLPGLVFQWTPFFEFHEFGAAPIGIIGHLIMLAFYAAVAALISWPFREKKR